MPVAAEEAAGQFGVFALRVHLTSCDSPRARGGGGRRDATDLRDRLEPPWRCSGLFYKETAIGIGVSSAAKPRSAKRLSKRFVCCCFERRSK